MLDRDAIHGEKRFRDTRDYKSSVPSGVASALARLGANEARALSCKREKQLMAINLFNCL